MSSWILILLLSQSTSGSVATTNVEFLTEAGCMEAGKKAKTQFEYYTVKYICVEKK